MFIESFEDATLIILIVSAVVSFAVGFYEDPAKGWIEGAAILAAVLIVAVVTACNNYSKEMQFRKLNAQKDDVKVVSTTIHTIHTIYTIHTIHTIPHYTTLYNTIHTTHYLKHRSRRPTYEYTTLIAPVSIHIKLISRCTIGYREAIRTPHS